MKLHASLAGSQQSALPAVVLLHGLFGSLGNLGMLARNLLTDQQVLQVDMRNHGLSPRSDNMDYREMAQDVLDTIDACQLDKVSLIGHSMGGKVAMAFAALAGQRLVKLVVLDTAPVDYKVRRHDAIFTAVEAVSAAAVHSRTQAVTLMQRYISDNATIMFLLKSFHNGNWQFNVPVLKACYRQIVGWQTLTACPQPALFIRGANSAYLQPDHHPALLAQFPAAHLTSIADAGHWVHAEQPQTVIQQIRQFFSEPAG